MAKIPQSLHQPINAAYPANVCLVATALPSGFAQVTPRGSVTVLDDETVGFWERGRGSTNESLKEGTKITIYFRDPKLRESGALPKGGIARIYGTAQLHKSGPMREKVWNSMIPVERERDPEQKGFAVTFKVERAEELDGTPLK